MIYIIISNIGLAIMMLLVYGRYSRFRIVSGSEIRDLKSKLSKEVEERKHVEQRLKESNKTDSDRIGELLKSVDDLRREKEGEMKIRLEAEKQIEIALQKTDEVQKRIQDWRAIQDAVMKDSRDAIIRLGNDLFKKLSDSYKVEVETNRNLLGRLAKNITDLFEKVGSSGSATSAKVGMEMQQSIPADNDSSTQQALLNDLHASDDIAKKLVSDLTSTMKANGHLVNKDYFLPANFDAEKAKLLLCEVSFVGDGKLYIFDFKACRYLEEYKHLKSTNLLAAEESLKQKLDKYFAYLSNAKYRESIMKVMSSTRAKFEKSAIIIILPSKVELQIMKEIRYYEKAHKVELEVMDFDGASNLVI